MTLLKNDYDMMIFLAMVIHIYPPEGLLSKMSICQYCIWLFLILLRSSCDVSTTTRCRRRRSRRRRRPSLKPEVPSKSKLRSSGRPSKLWLQPSCPEMLSASPCNPCCHKHQGKNKNENVSQRSLDVTKRSGCLMGN